MQARQGDAINQMSAANAGPARSASAIARSLKKRRSHQEEEEHITQSDLQRLYSHPERPYQSVLSIYLNVDQSQVSNQNRGFE